VVLDPLAERLLRHYLDAADNVQGTSWWGRTKIARKLDCNVNSINRSRNQLVALNLVRVVECPDPGLYPPKAKVVKVVGYAETFIDEPSAYTEGDPSRDPNSELRTSELPNPQLDELELAAAATRRDSPRTPSPAGPAALAAVITEKERRCCAILVSTGVEDNDALEIVRRYPKKLVYDYERIKTGVLDQYRNDIGNKGGWWHDAMKHGYASRGADRAKTKEQHDRAAAQRRASEAAAERDHRALDSVHGRHHPMRQKLREAPRRPAYIQTRDGTEPPPIPTDVQPTQDAINFLAKYQDRKRRRCPQGA
jgi:hypothetical protein